MATITIHKNKINNMGILMKSIIKATGDLDSQLDVLKDTLMGIDGSTCNMEEAVESIRSSSKSENEKVEKLKQLNEKIEEFIDLTTWRDAWARGEIVKAKKDFYARYSYLMPNCEREKKKSKSLLAKAWSAVKGAVKSVGEFCKKHWKEILIAVEVIVAVVCICCPVPGLQAVGALMLKATVKGALIGMAAGAALGGITAGLEYKENGKSFWEGFKKGVGKGAVSGAVNGAFFGAVFGFGALAGTGLNVAFNGAACLTKLGSVIKGTAAVTKLVGLSMFGFDLLALGDRAFGKGNIAEMNKELHKNKYYNGFQFAISTIAAFTGGMGKTLTCFVAGTLVWTVNGLMAIEHIKAGDLVFAADEKNPTQVALKPVLETYVRESSKLVHLTINGEEIITTYEHPFYVAGQGFVHASALFIGAELLDRNGKSLFVEQIYREELDGETRTVYNFKVDEYHTYCVSEDGILVHNAQGYETKTVELKDEKGKKYKEESIPKAGKKGSQSWKQAVKDLKAARGKGNNFVAESKEAAKELIKEAKPDLQEYPEHSKGADVPSQRYEIHGIDNNYNMPHVRFWDYIPGHKSEGCQGHIFWEE